MMEPEEAAEQLLAAITHDERCGGYGGWWATELDGGAVGWAIPPQHEDDGVGYVVCQCFPIMGQLREQRQAKEAEQ